MSYQTLLSDAERFCFDAEAEKDHGNQVSVRLSTAAILFAFMAVESFINNMMFDFASVPEDMFSLQERGFLSEKAVEFSTSGRNAGHFNVSNRREYKAIEDKILFLVARFSGDTVDKGDVLWQRFKKSKDVRDSLTHPRRHITVPPSPLDARDALEVAKDIINLVSNKVWHKTLDL